MDKKKTLEVEMKNTLLAIKEVSEQINIFKKKAQELASHHNYVKGAIDIIDDIILDLKEGATENVSTED